MRAPCLDHGQMIGQEVYGSMKVAGKSVKVHRVAYARANGLDVLSMGGVVLHSCDNRRCIEPSHLSLGTHQDNSDDMLAKGRHWVPCGEASATCKLTDAQVAEIRLRYKPYCRVNGSRPLAREFGMSSSHISAIANDTARKKV